MNILKSLFVITCLMEVSSKQFLDKGLQIKRRKKYAIPTLRPRSIRTPPSPYALLNGSKIVDCPVNRNKRSVLTDQHLIQILKAEGGAINPRLMAVTEEDAQKQFTNMLPLPTVPSETNVLSKDEIVTKEQVYKDISRWNSYLKMLVSSQNVSYRNTSSDKQNPLDATIRIFFRNRKRPINYVSKSLLREFGDYILHSDNSSVIGNAIADSGVKIHPSVLQSLETIGSRRKRQAGGATMKLQYCINKGVQQPDGFLALCSTCAVTTTLDKDKFPRYVNEVICTGSDRTCLNVGNTPHGACKETSLQLDFLQIVPRGCRMMIENNGEEIVHEWEKYTQRVRTGCTCAINKLSRLVPSFFPQFVGR